MPLRIGLSARDGAGGRARVHLRGRRTASASGAIVSHAVRPRARARDRRRARRRARPTGVDARADRRRRRRRSRRRSSSSRSGSPTTTARRRRARSRSSRRRRRSGARSRRRRPSGRRSAARPSRVELSDAAAARRSRGSSTAIDAGGGNFLLYGATGSGKTEVYLQACAAVLERGLGAIVLVPEIALAPQTVGRVRARFGDRVAILHSGADRRRAARRARADRERRGADRRRRALGGLRAGARARADRRRRGARPVVQAGLRPALRRAHGRGEARRARGRGRGLRLGDAAARELGGARAARARRPASAATLPPVRVVDLRREAGYPLSAPLLDALRGVAEQRRQGDPAAQPARRRAGAALPRVRHDDPLPELRRRARPARRRVAALPPLRLTPSRRRRTARRAARPSSRGSAPGTQKLERELARELPELELIRLDADAVAKPEQLAASLRALRRGRRRGAARHADGREGPPLRGRRARGGDRRRHGARDAGLPRRGAHVPADHAARRPQRPRRARAACSCRRSSPTRARSRTRRGTTSARFLAEELERRRGARLPAVRAPRAHRRRRARSSSRSLRALEELKAGISGAELLGPAPLLRLRGKHRAQLVAKTDAPARGRRRRPRACSPPPRRRCAAPG